MNLLEELKTRSNKTALRYLAVGFFTYVFEMVFLWLLRNTFGLRDVYAVAISFWFGLALSFALQKLVAFKNLSYRAKHVSKQLLGFSMLVGFNYLFTLLAVYYLAPKFSIYTARTLVIIIITIWNYRIYKLLFRIDK